MLSRRPLLLAMFGGLFSQSGPGPAVMPARRSESEREEPNSVELLRFKSSVTGTQSRSLLAKLDDQAVSVTDFMTADEVADSRGDQPRMDVTAAFNVAFEAARKSGRTVIVPDGRYLVGNLLFGTQNATGQSSSPLGLVGQSRSGTVLIARPGLTGTLLKSWSVAGVQFSDFHIVTEGTSAQAWDCAWKPFVGPSTQNLIYNIMVTGGTAPLHVNWNDLNDTFPFNVTVRVHDGSTSAKSCGISAVQSGGLTVLRGIATANCYLRIGTQNGELDGCWGSGVELAAGSLNFLKIDSCYFYCNPTKKAVIWSESFEGAQAAYALTFIACQFITDNVSDSSYLNINLYSGTRIIGCMFTGLATELLGPQARRDPFSQSAAVIRIEGGTGPNLLSLNDRGAIEIVAEDFMNGQTGRPFTKDRSGNFTPQVRGTIVAGTCTRHSDSYARYVRTGNLVNFRCRIVWSAHTGRGSIILSGLPFVLDEAGVSSVVLESHSSTFPSGVMATFTGREIGLFSQGVPLAVSTAGELIVSGFYSVKA